MKTQDQKYRFRKSFNGKWILQVYVHETCDALHDCCMDVKTQGAWFDADAVEANTAMYILNRD